MLDMLDILADWFGPKGEHPNKFTIYMGEQIRTAREEAGLSQEKLASLIYLRRATLSDIENGKVETDASTLSFVSYYLRKPLLYFFPKPIYEELVQKDMDVLSLEMQMQFEQVDTDDLKKLAINIVRELGKFDPENMVIELAPFVKAKIEMEEETARFFEKRRKKK